MKVKRIIQDITIKQIIIAIFLVCILAFSVSILIKQPSNDKEWNKDQQILSSAEIDHDNNNNLVHVYNIRNNTYRNTTDFDVAYYDKTYDLNQLKTVDYMVEHIADFKGPAHTFLSFGFEEVNSQTNQTQIQYLVISVEIRKEVGESFSPIKGLLREYELMYVFADENDVLKLRTNYRNDTVYLYPINTTHEKMKKLFLDMVERTNTLKDNPEFYNTISSSCTTNIVDHVNAIAPYKVPVSFKILLPSYSDELAYDLGLIDTNLPFEQAQEKYFITDIAQEHANKPHFSQAVRSRR